MAERLSTLPGAWSVAHYVELRGDIDPRCWPGDCHRAAQADTLSMRFCEDNGEAWQWVDDIARLPNRITDLRAASDRTRPRWR
jgi:enterobactin synthetase component F